jgi:hypothetical protein
MNPNKNIIVTLVLMIIVAALYRVIPERPMGFAPHLAMALFGGAVIKDKKLAFAFPIFSMFVSDVVYHLLYINGLTAISGFYEGQFTNYILFAGMTAIAMLMRKVSVQNIIGFTLVICTAYFLLSNFFVWNAGSGLGRPHTFAGLMQAYEDGLPFYRNSIIATLLFSGVLFGAWKLITGFKPLVNQ